MLSQLACAEAAGEILVELDQDDLLSTDCLPEVVATFDGAQRRGLLTLDLGAAHNKPDGYIGFVVREGPHVDIVGDVSHGIDLPDGSVGVIRAVDFLEHVPNKIDLSTSSTGS